ncbi:hypothetical protein [Tateyamaria omphalii]|uniref:Peptide methionine sulfoxide reductase n=1 Tax=Tateyamaria omphalii TaxID=299262 RepID=A0A1P8MWB1_9RHOB|nr:hypothetical protein [Tateyamaria omphalii]APX12308.1 hypothetical protein BWR18_11940 [Tateyamaria omphalii]
MSTFETALGALPCGTFQGTAHGRRYVVTKSRFAGDKSIKLVAEELGGADYISLNWYALASGGRLKPCEMPEAKVREFVVDLVVD